MFPVATMVSTGRLIGHRELQRPHEAQFSVVASSLNPPTPSLCPTNLPAIMKGAIQQIV